MPINAANCNFNASMRFATTGKTHHQSDTTAINLHVLVSFAFYCIHFVRKCCLHYLAIMYIGITKETRNQFKYTAVVSQQKVRFIKNCDKCFSLNLMLATCSRQRLVVLDTGMCTILFSFVLHCLVFSLHSKAV